MTKGFPSLIGNNGGSIRHKTIQKLQLLVLIFVMISLTLKIYVQMFDSDYPCGKCASHENLPEKIDNETDNETNESSMPTILTDDIDYTYENDNNDSNNDNNDIYIEPAFHPLPHSNVTYDFTVVTGASQNHFCPTKSFLYYMKDVLKGFNARLILYDLGFSNSQREELLKLQKLGYLTELRTFQWSHYPDFWNITIAKGEYAWKPGMVAEVARDYPGKLVWLDSGTLVKRKYFTSLDFLLNKYNGFVSPRSSATMKVWTHPGVYDYYGDDHKKYDRVANCNGASVTFDTTKTKQIIDDWFDCALVKDCIAPPGSSRINHRQDQAILTYLVAKNKLTCNYKKENIGILTHEDRHCRKYIYEYESTHRI